MSFIEFSIIYLFFSIMSVALVWVNGFVNWEDDEVMFGCAIFFLFGPFSFLLLSTCCILDFLDELRSVKNKDDINK